MLKQSVSLWYQQARLPSRRPREEIIRSHKSSLDLHAALINKLYVDRRGLIDYEDSQNRNRRTLETELIDRDRLTISRLSLNKTHQGEFLLCRVIGGSFQLMAVVTIVEDPDGHVERLFLYNWTNPPEMIEAENLKHRKYIPIGTIMCIRNPKYCQAADGNTCIRCDNASDVIIMKNHHPILHNVKWECKPIQNTELLLPNPKLQRYQLSRRQTIATTEESHTKFTSTPIISQETPSSSSSHSQIKLRSVIPTPTTCTNLIQTPPSSSAEKRLSKRQRDKRTTKGHSSKIKRRNIQSDFFQKPDVNNTLVVCCFIIFLWYVFFS